MTETQNDPPNELRLREQETGMEVYPTEKAYNTQSPPTELKVKVHPQMQSKAAERRANGLERPLTYHQIFMWVDCAASIGCIIYQIVKFDGI